MPNLSVNAHQYDGPLAAQGVTGFVNNGVAAQRGQPDLRRRPGRGRGAGRTGPGSVVRPRRASRRSRARPSSARAWSLPGLGASASHGAGAAGLRRSRSEAGPHGRSAAEARDRHGGDSRRAADHGQRHQLPLGHVEPAVQPEPGRTEHSLGSGHLRRSRPSSRGRAGRAGRAAAVRHPGGGHDRAGDRRVRLGPEPAGQRKTTTCSGSRGPARRARSCGPRRSTRTASMVTVNAPFRVYSNVAQSITDHSLLLATGSSYKQAMADRRSPDAFANDLTGVYATDPNYGASLIAHHAAVQPVPLRRWDARGGRAGGPSRAGTGASAPGRAVGPGQGWPAQSSSGRRAAPGRRGTAAAGQNAVIPGAVQQTQRPCSGRAADRARPVTGRPRAAGRRVAGWTWHAPRAGTAVGQHGHGTAEPGGARAAGAGGAGAGAPEQVAPEQVAPERRRSEQVAAAALRAARRRRRNGRAATGQLGRSARGRVPGSAGRSFPGSMPTPARRPRPPARA